MEENGLYNTDDQLIIISNLLNCTHSECNDNQIISLFHLEQGQVL